MKQVDELRPYLEQKLEIHKKKDSKDNDSLLASLLEWGALVPSHSSLYDAIRSQIEYQANKNNVTPLEFIDYLFSQNNYNLWMHVFQA
jgi:hypothetical protein